jgi:methionyl-tRNA formyltransferase
MRVITLGCSDLAVEVCNSLLTVPGVTQISLVCTPYVIRKRSLLQKLIHIHKTQGLAGLVSNMSIKVLGSSSREPLQIASPVKLDSRAGEFKFANFHDPLCVAQIRSLLPDLGVIAGTYILKESVFSIPAQGCVNLHTGKVPEYRGAAPAFWEMYNGESSVGITIHRVVTAVDAGNILLQEDFPFDSAPQDDPLAYIERYRKEVLLPNGVRMLTEVVARIAAGIAEERPQDTHSARTYRSPTHEDVRELRRRVAERRKEMRTR